MKSLFILIASFFFISYSSNGQQKHKVKNETNGSKTKVKPNTTVTDKVHNVIHPRHKRHHGLYVKHKS